jgi:hypothetical protein
MMRSGAKRRKTQMTSALILGAVVLWAGEAPAQTEPRARTADVAAPPPAAVLALQPPARAALRPSPVVLELYTSQGCVSCPPADRMLATLIDRDDVIPLALHVDYWDYIGWADPFADPEYGERQKRYARRHGHSTIYTPQVVINGVDIMEGFRVMQVMDAIEAHRRVDPVATLTLTRGPDGMVLIEAEALEAPTSMVVSRAESRSAAALSAAMEDVPDAGGLVVQLVRYMPRAMTEITAGENAGLTADYVNIVTSWETVGTWDLRVPLQMSVMVQGESPAVVLIQEAGQGAIVAAGQLR